MEYRQGRSSFTCARVFFLVLVSLLVCACSSTHKAPQVFAYKGGGADRWPQNSLGAIYNSIKYNYQGIALDVVLTRDNKPVLAHSPWLPPKYCRRTLNHKPNLNEIYIRQFTLQQLQESYHCGNKNAQPIASLEEALTTLKGLPQISLYLDIKISADKPYDAEHYAEAIREVWEKHKLPNELYVETPTKESLEIFRQSFKLPFVGILTFPDFTAAHFANNKESREQISNNALSLEQAVESRADAIAAPANILPPQIFNKLKNGGIKTILFTANNKQELKELCQWPVDILMTNHPELGNCLHIN